MSHDGMQNTGPIETVRSSPQVPTPPRLRGSKVTPSVRSDERYQLSHACVAHPLGTSTEALDSQSGARVHALCLRMGHATGQGMDSKQLEAVLEPMDALRDADHPAIVRPLDVTRTQAGHILFITPPVAGQPLHELLRGTSMPATRAIAILRQLCEALAAVHATGLHHGALCASSVLVRKTPRPDTVAVLDFGVASVLPHATMPEGSLVSWAPMSPERAAGSNCDVREDIYLLGCLGYAMMTGQPWVRATTSKQLTERHAAPPLPNAFTRGNIPEALREVLQQCLQRDAGLRMATVTELDAALAVAQTRLGIAAHTEHVPRPSPQTARRVPIAKPPTATAATHGLSPTDIEFVAHEPSGELPTRVGPGALAYDSETGTDLPAASAAKPARMPAPPPAKPPTTHDSDIEAAQNPVFFDAYDDPLTGKRASRVAPSQLPSKTPDNSSNDPLADFDPGPTRVGLQSKTTPPVTARPVSRMAPFAPPPLRSTLPPHIGQAPALHGAFHVQPAPAHPSAACVAPRATLAQAGVHAPTSALTPLPAPWANTGAALQTAPSAPRVILTPTGTEKIILASSVSLPHERAANTVRIMRSWFARTVPQMTAHAGALVEMARAHPQIQRLDRMHATAFAGGVLVGAVLVWAAM